MACCWCCFSPPAKEESKPLIVDITQVLADEAWTTFLATLNYVQRKCIRRKNFSIDIPENYFSFDAVGNTEFENIDQSAASVGDDGDSKEVQKEAAALLPGSSVHAATTVTHNVTPNDSGESVSLMTSFDNDTTQKQTYQFKFSKTRTSSVEVTYQKGFTIGGKANFSLGLPKSMSLGVTIDTRYEVKQSEGQRFQDSTTMEATSDITVAPNSSYLAMVQLGQRSIHANFKLRMRLSMPQKRASIYIRQKSDGKVVFVFIVRNLEDIFCSKKRPFPSTEKVLEGADTAEDKVDFLVEGILKGSLVCDHKIRLKSDEPQEQKEKAKMQHLEEQESARDQQ